MMQSNYKPIGDYIKLVDERNKGLNINNLIGVSISKQFIKSVANIIGTDMENYKIIRKNQFACSIMQVRRDKKMPIALYRNEQPSIISQAYPVFEITNPAELLPEYLMMWFTRSEFDREACFHAVGGVRGSLEWEDFCNMKLPIPSLEKQLEMIKEYNIIQNRIKLNNQLIAKLEETAQAIYKQWFVDFEFPDENGLPYKSSGGKMEWSDEIEKEIPKNWSGVKLNGISVYISSKVCISKLNKNNYISTENMLQNRGGIIEITNLPIGTTVNRFSVNDILISNIRPYFKKIWQATYDGGCSNDILCFRAYDSIQPQFLYYTLETDAFFDYVMAGSNGAKMPRGDKDWIMDYKIALPTDRVLRLFSSHISKLQYFLNARHKENSILQSLFNPLYSKMTKVKIEKELA